MPESIFNSVDDSIPHTVRYKGSTYGDEVIRYTGVTIYVEEDKISVCGFGVTDC